MKISDPVPSRAAVAVMSPAPVLETVPAPASAAANVASPAPLYGTTPSPASADTANSTEPAPWYGVFPVASNADTAKATAPVPVLETVPVPANSETGSDKAPLPCQSLSPSWSVAASMSSALRSGLLGSSAPDQQAATQLDEKTWLDESHELAKTMAYDDDVRAHVRVFEMETIPN